MSDRRVVLLFVLVFAGWFLMGPLLALARGVLPPGWLDGLAFDAAGALFSGLAFAGLVWTIWAQQRQIDEGRAGHAALTAAQERQAEHLAEAARLQAQSARLFEQKLQLSAIEVLERRFRLQLEAWVSYGERMEVEAVPERGRALAGAALAAIRAAASGDPAARPPARLIRVRRSGRIEVVNTVFGPFVSLLDDLLAVIATSPVQPEDRWVFARIVRAHLGIDERLFLLALAFKGNMVAPAEATSGEDRSSDRFATNLARFRMLDGVAEAARQYPCLSPAWERYSAMRKSSNGNG